MLTDTNHQLAKCYALVGKKKHLQIHLKYSLWKNKHIPQPKRRFSHQFHQVTRQVVFSGNFQERPGVHTLYWRHDIKTRTSRVSGGKWAAAAQSPMEASPDAQPSCSRQVLAPNECEHSQQNEGLTNANLPCTRMLTEQTKSRISNKLRVTICVTRGDLAPQLTSLIAAVSPARGLPHAAASSMQTSILLKFQVTNNDHCACGSHTFQNIHKWWQVNK